MSCLAAGIVLTVEDNDDGLTSIATDACEAGVIVITWSLFVDKVKVWRGALFGGV